MKTFAYNLRPSPAQTTLFDETQETCRRFYNHALAERKTTYTERSETLAFARQFGRQLPTAAALFAQIA